MDERNRFAVRFFEYGCCWIAAIVMASTLIFANISANDTVIAPSGIPLYYWRQPQFVNFGDYLSLKLVERIVDQNVEVYIRKPKFNKKKLLAIGSILSFAIDGDVVWGTGVGKLFKKSDHPFTTLDVRAVRGPLTRAFLQDILGVQAPEIYGDPGLLFPYFFPEFKKKKNPVFNFIVIPHFSELHMPIFSKIEYSNIVSPLEPWDEVIKKILDSKFVIASSLHGLVIAEAYGIPARYLRVTENEPIFKYIDYYMGTGRNQCVYASSIEEALLMGGEEPAVCNLDALYKSFPFEFWPDVTPRKKFYER